MIVDVFVPEHDGVNSLGDEVGLLMRDENWMSGIADNLIDSFDEFDSLVDQLEKENPRVGGEASAIEVDGDFFVLVRPDCQFGRFHVTLCLGRLWIKCVAFLVQPV